METSVMIIVNTGSMVRRRSDEKNIRPRIGMLMEDGTIEPYYLDISKDKYIEDIDPEKEKMDDSSLDDLMEDLTKLGDAFFDFKEVAEQVMSKHNLTENQQQIFRNAMEKDNGK